MAPHSSTLAWEPPWTEGPGGYILGVTKSQTRVSDSAPALCDGPHPGLWSVSLNKSHFLLYEKKKKIPLILKGSFQFRKLYKVICNHFCVSPLNILVKWVGMSMIILKVEKSR